jgi:hypothetical protein
MGMTVLYLFRRDTLGVLYAVRGLHMSARQAWAVASTDTQQVFIRIPGRTVRVYYI